MAIPIYDTLVEAGKTIINKIWMDKDKKEQITLDRDALGAKFNLALSEMEQTGELAKIDKEYRESQAQRNYANDQFGSAVTLSSFFFGKIILLGRAAIRWVITGFAMWQVHRIVGYVLTEKVLTGLAAGTLGVGGVWLVTMLVCLVIGIPLFYVAGVSVEKILKARSVV